MFEERSPILSSCFPTMRPWRAALDDEAGEALVPRPDVRAHTTITPACAPEVIHCLLPLSTHWSPVRIAAGVHRARIASPPAARTARTSRPPPRPRPAAGTNFSRCASRAERVDRSAHMFVTAMVTETRAVGRGHLHHRQRVGHRARLRAAVARGDVHPHQPQLPSSLESSVGKISARSASRAPRARPARCANLRAVSPRSASGSRSARGSRASSPSAGWRR